MAARPQRRAKRRLADEYDAAQERGEVASGRPKKTIPDGNTFQATTEDLGLTSKEIHEARQVRAGQRLGDMEKAKGGSPSKKTGPHTEQVLADMGISKKQSSN